MGAASAVPAVPRRHAYRTSRRIERAETARAFEPGNDTPVREIFYYETSKAVGKMTALTDLYGRLTPEPVPSRGRQAASPEFMIALIAQKLKGDRIHLVCIDEAQEISADNLKLLRQIPDAAAAIGHPMGILYIGLHELRDKLVAAGQLGQRVATEIQFPVVDRATLSPHFHSFHPALSALRDSMSKKAWSDLEASVFAAAAGKFRRLHTLIRNAEALSRELGRPMDEKILAAAIHKLAPEV